ncbi:hypothetical protein DERF_005693 [Dermatophagoides farinae]|uniref:DUF7041 domain-containing protein n=1 Tax=Dermatophagoides farinae TaxID=6954 RepID=A0A922I4S3_DERFA|nr:uncharacterized protein LOC124500460 [Dermatophagoides farinae]KAH7639325.1 hypothetical protein HUG17_3358 [Dermatophagoides farinae]KAH9522091.1 hypothetical protein DERF_005693 [Dermatophagoides farinae]
MDSNNDNANDTLMSETGEQANQVDPALVASLLQSMHSMMIEMKKDRDTLQAMVTDMRNERRSRPATNIDMPPFIDTDPRGWLEAVSACFNAAHVNDEKDQFFKIVSQLPKTIRDNLKHKLDLIDYTDGKLASLKDLIIREYELSETIRRDRILSRKDLENQKPSVAWSWLLNMGKNVFTIVQLLAFWEKLLPKDIGLSIHHVIVPIERQLTENPNDPQVLQSIAGIVHMADSLIEKYGTTTNNHQVSAISRSRTASTSNNNNNPNSRNIRKRQAFRDDGPYCRNHFLYGNRANRCGRPQSCTFLSRSNRSNQSNNQSNRFNNPRSNTQSRSQSPNPSQQQQQPSSTTTTAANQTN